MAIVDVVMPKMGESIMEATVLKWHKQPGDTVKMDETLLDIATDKVDSEVPSTTAGVVKELLYKENDVVPVGAPIARIETSGGAAAPAPAAAPATPAPQVQAAAAVAQPVAVAAAPASGTRFYSPLVLNIAGTEGIGMAELERIPGTGNEGRVTKKRHTELCSQQRCCTCSRSGSCCCAGSCCCRSGSCCACTIYPNGSIGQCRDSRNGQDAQAYSRPHGSQQGYFSARYQLHRGRCNQHREMARKSKRLFREKTWREDHVYAYLLRSDRELYPQIPYYQLQSRWV